MIDLRTGGRVRLLVACLIFLIPAVAAARTLTVTAGDKSGIGGALAGAVSGDIVQVGCGVYHEGGLVIPDGVILTGLGADPGCVTVMSSGYLPLIMLTGSGSGTRVENMTLMLDPGGSMPVARGCGVLLENASPVFSNVVLKDFEADYGGAVYCSDGSAPLFEDCRFEGNYARASGGAVACVGASMPEFLRCLFADNSAEVSGGAVNAALGSAPSLTECTVVGSDADAGAALASWDAAGMVLDRVIIVDSLDGRSWDGDAPSVPAADCTDIFGNAGGDWVGALEPFATINGNISADPEFCGGLGGTNPYTINDASPCAPAANPGCGRIGAYDVACSFVAGTGGGSGGLPVANMLYDNYPNPFNPRTAIKFDLKESGPVDLAVFDIAGRLVKRLVSETMSAGQHDAVWEGRDSRGRQAAAGVYFFRLKTVDTIDTKRMTLVK